MSYQTRRIIFWAMVALFVILSPLAVFYSKGYRFDFQKLEAFKVGGLNLQVKTTGAEIFINDRLRAQTGGLLYSGSFFKLLPRTYEVRVAKDGYYAWEKKLAVTPNLVTDVFNILLFPESPEIKELSGAPIDFFSFSPDRSKILTANISTGALSSSPVLKTTILDQSGAPVENFSDFSLKWLKNPQIKILANRWAPNAESFLLKIEGDKKIHWLIAAVHDKNEISGAANSAKNPVSGEAISGKKETAKETASPEAKTRRLVIVNEEIKKSLSLYEKSLEGRKTAPKTAGISAINAPLDELFFNPQNPKELLFLANGDIYAFDAETKLVKNAKINNNPTMAIQSFLAEGKNIWWLDETGVIKKNDLNVNLIKEIFRIPDFASSSADYRFTGWDDTFGIQIIPAGNKISEGIKSEFYLYNNKRIGAEFFPLEGTISAARFSPDGKKLLYLKNGEAAVRYLEEIKMGDVKKAGDEDLIMKGIKDAAWLKTSDYLMLADENSIKIAELDGRSKRNVFEIAETKTVSAFCHPAGEKIYFLDGGLFKTASLK